MTASPSQWAESRAAVGRPSLPFLMFCLYTFVLIGRPQDYVPALVPLRLALVFTALTCVVTALQAGNNRVPLLRHTETKLYFILFGVMCAGIPFSIYPRRSFNSVILEYLSNMAFYVLFLIHVDTLQRYRRIVFVLVASTLVFSLAGMFQGDFLDGRYVTGGHMFDPNDVAFVELSLLSFGISILLGSFGMLTKAMALVSVLLSILLTLYTGSRGGLLGLATIVFLFLIVKIPGAKKSYKTVMLIFVGIAAVMTADADKINVERYSTLRDLSTDYNSHDEFGRMQLWKRGLQLALEDPLTGVGVDNFGEAIGHMRTQESVLPRWQAAHNSYVQVLAETGIVGGLLFLLLNITCLRTFNRLRRRRGSFGDADLNLLPGVLLVGFVGQIVAAFFLTQAYSVIFTLSFAASAGLKGIATGHDPALRVQTLKYPTAAASVLPPTGSAAARPMLKVEAYERHSHEREKQSRLQRR